MTKRILAVATVLLVALPAAAQAYTTIIEPVGSHFPYQQWVDESEMPTPDATFTVIETSAEHGCPGRERDYAACTSPREHLIWIAPAAINPVFGYPRSTFYHELGHSEDELVLPEWARSRFAGILGLVGPWRVIAEPQPYSPSERFAEAYADCSMTPYLTHPRLVVDTGWILNVRRHNQICRMIERAG
jgi:hypothetical protein